MNEEDGLVESCCWPAAGSNGVCDSCQMATKPKSKTLTHNQMNEIQVAESEKYGSKIWEIQFR